MWLDVASRMAIEKACIQKGIELRAQNMITILVYNQYDLGGGPI